MRALFLLLSFSPLPSSSSPLHLFPFIYTTSYSSLACPPNTAMEVRERIPRTPYLYKIDTTPSPVFLQQPKMRQAPVFTNWEYCHSFADNDLFKVPVAMPVNPDYHSGKHCLRKVRVSSGIAREQMQKKQGRRRGPKAVDEDLYKVPKELLYQKPKRKRLLRTLLSGCLNLTCIA